MLFTILQSRLARRSRQRQRGCYKSFCCSTALEANSSTGQRDLTWLQAHITTHIFDVRRDKLRANILLKQHQLEVDLRHIGLFNDELAHAIQERPGEILPYVRSRYLLVYLIFDMCSSLSRPLRRLRVPFSFPSRRVLKLLKKRQLFPSLRCISSSNLVSTCSNSATSPPIL